MRSRLASLILLLLLPAAWNAVPAAQRNLQLASRLRERHRVAPDTQWDRYYAEVMPLVPPSGRIGLVQDVPLASLTGSRQYYFLQYALAPRVVVPDSREPFVVAHVPAARAGTLIDPNAYALVRAFGDDFALLRKVAP